MQNLRVSTPFTRDYGAAVVSESAESLREITRVNTHITRVNAHVCAECSQASVGTLWALPS